MIVDIFINRAFIDFLSYNVFYKIMIWSVKKSKIAQVVCPETRQTNPLMPIGGHPANAMVFPDLSWDWWGRSRVLRLGVERQQVMCHQSFLQFEEKGNILQINSNVYKHISV